MPSGLAYPITDAHKSTRPSSQPTLSHAASPSNFDIEPRRSRRVRRPSAHKLESDEYEASSRGSTRPPTPSEPDPKPKSKKPAKNTRGNRPGHIVQPNADAGSTSHGSTPEPIGTPRPRPGGSFLASECATGDQPELDKAEAIRRATAFLGTDASKLPARIIQDVLYRIPHDAEDQATPMELEGGSAPAILQPAGRVVLGSRHEPSASRTTDNVGSQAPNAQPADAQLPLDTSRLGRSFNEDTVTESESELEDIELGLGDSVSQRLPPALPPPPTTTLSPRAHPTPNSHPLRHPDQITRSKAFIAAAVDDPAPESGSNSGSDRDLPAPARKHQRLAEPPRSNNLPHGSRTNPSASRPRIPSTTHRPPTSSTLARPAAPAAPTETTSTSSPASSLNN
ncbi:hypothetical protein FS749_012633 [Ceratobasidium sp. UAMH 11750]|nr:hypothetical protein FS749_012633 [Ceratobasidium sp. UAMH 11750]